MSRVTRAAAKMLRGIADDLNGRAEDIEAAEEEPDDEPGFGQEVVDGEIVWKGDYGPKDVAKCRRCLRVQDPEHMDLSADGYLCKVPCVRDPDSEMEGDDG